MIVYQELNLQRYEWRRGGGNHNSPYLVTVEPLYKDHPQRQETGPYRQVMLIMMVVIDRFDCIRFISSRFMLRHQQKWVNGPYRPPGVKHLHVTSSSFLLLLLEGEEPYSILLLLLLCEGEHPYSTNDNSPFSTMMMWIDSIYTPTSLSTFLDVCWLFPLRVVSINVDPSQPFHLCRQRNIDVLTYIVKKSWHLSVLCEFNQLALSRIIDESICVGIFSREYKHVELILVWLYSLPN